MQSTGNLFQTAMKIEFSRYTGYSQKNGVVSKVNNKFISYLTRAQRTPSAAAAVQVPHVLPAFVSHAYCGAAGPVSKMALKQEKAFCVLRFEVSRSVITVQREFCARFRTAGSVTKKTSSLSVQR
jgi:hypothetical protein